MANEDSKITKEVAAAYRELEQEVPPTELDELILNAAKSELKEPQSASSSFNYRPYSIAASVCLCVLIVSMFVNNKRPGPASSPMRSKAESTQILELRAEPLAESAVFLDETEDALGLEDSNANAANSLLIQTEADDVSLRTQEVEEIIVTGARIATEEFAPRAVQTVLDYRSSAEFWIMEIQSLLESDAAVAQQEINLFTEAYPDVDLDQALSELEQ